MSPSSVSAVRTPAGWDLATHNVHALRFDPKQYAWSDIHAVDGERIAGIAGNAIGMPEIERTGSGWRPVGRSASRKTPAQSGPFKLAFQNHFTFVVATHGTPEENAWAANKARFDAEQWYYRGNGLVDIIRDDEAGRYRGRNLILYGHADMNSAWKLLKNSPILVGRGSVAAGGREFSGEDLSAVFLRPEGSRLIGVVAGTGMAGLRTCDRLPYFTSGVAYPDWTVLRTSTLREGSKAVLGAGFFGNDWKFDPKQSAFLAG